MCREMDNLSELAELCWNLGALNELKADDRRTCRHAHEHQATMGGTTIAFALQCISQLDVMGIRRKNERDCRRRHHLPRL